MNSIYTLQSINGTELYKFIFPIQENEIDKLLLSHNFYPNNDHFFSKYKLEFFAGTFIGYHRLEKLNYFAKEINKFENIDDGIIYISIKEKYNAKEAEQFQSGSSGYYYDLRGSVGEALEDIVQREYDELDEEYKSKITFEDFFDKEKYDYFESVDDRWIIRVK